MVMGELLKLCILCRFVFSEELKLCPYINLCSETISLHIYTQLPFFIEHKSPCIYTASLLPEIRIDLSIVSSLVQKCDSVIGRFLERLRN